VTAPTRPRGRLPRRVYWVRRLVLLAVLAVVLGTGFGLVGPLVGPLVDSLPGGGGHELVTTTGAEVEVTPGPADPATGPSAAPSPEPSAADRGSRSRVAREPLPEPDGECADEDVVVAPHVADAHVGAPIRIVLQVSTRSTPACTWEVSPDSVFLKVLRGDEGSEVVWSSQQCPALVPTAQVVARQEQAAEVVVSWSGQMSDPGCTDLPAWVHAGEFRAVSIARGAVKPRDEVFELEKAVPEVVVVPPAPTPTPTPTPTDTPSPTDDR
jgi:hypothetical protein